jgi:hypothetical protein
MHAIVGALESLERLRTELKIEAGELMNMGKLDTTHLIRQAQRGDKPYLRSLRTLLVLWSLLVIGCISSVLDEVVASRPGIDVSTIADSSQQIHWAHCTRLILELERSTSRLLSPQKYMFNRDRVIGFVKKSLINVRYVGDIRSAIDSARREYRKIKLPAPPLWRRGSSHAH